MKLTAWRIYKPRHAASALTGEGARLFGGRFNSKGTAIIYASCSASLASLEMLVHLQSSEILQGYVLRQATFDVSLVRLISRSDLPTGWRRNPSSAATRRVGDEWAASGISAALQVPSAIVPIENNFLFNPNHPDFALIEWGRQERYRFDPRLAGR